MIQGTRRHHWYLSRSFRLCRQVSGTGRKEPFLRSPATPQRLTMRKMLIRTETRSWILRPETLFEPVKKTATSRSGWPRTYNAKRRRERRLMLVRKTILAPVVILDSQGPQQQGWVTDRNHNILSRLHHIVTITTLNLNVSSHSVLLNKWLNVGVEWLFRTLVNIEQIRRPATKNSLMVQQLSPGMETF